MRILSFVRGDLKELQGFAFSLIALAVNDFDVVLSIALSDRTESGLFSKDTYSKSAFGLFNLVLASLLLVVLVVTLAAVVAMEVRGDVIEA